MPPVQPMLAKSVKGVPDPATFADDEHPGLLFEPKWDGFRCLVFKDGDEVELASRNTKPLTRYFPEVVAALRSPGMPDRCVLDGEIVVANDGRLEFDTLAGAHPPGRVAGEHAGRDDAGALRRLRRAGAGRRGPEHPPPRRTTGAAGGRALLALPTAST